VEHVACIGKMRNAYKHSFGKRKEKRPLRRPRRRREDNVKINLVRVWTGFI